MSHAQLLLAPSRPLAESWLLGTHQRRQRLDVPSFGHEGARAQALPRRRLRQAALQALPLDLPTHWLSLGEHLQGLTRPMSSSAQALALLLRHLATPLSWQPMNPYAVHRAVPSPRCAYPLQLWLLQLDGERTQAWRHVPEHHALEPVALPGLQSLAAQSPPRWLLLGLAAHWQLAAKYGDFTPFVTALEAGHQAAQAAQLATGLGWQTENLAGPAWCQALGALSEHPLDSLQWGLWIDGAAPLQLPAAKLTLLAELEPAPGLLDGFAELPRLLADFAQAPPAVKRAPTPAPSQPLPSAVPAIDLLQLMRDRSAGNDKPGLFPSLAQPLAMDQLVALAQGLQARRLALPGEAFLTVQLLQLQQPAGLYSAEGRLLQARPDAAALLQSALPSPRVRHAMAAHAVQLLWSVDLQAANQQLGRSALAQLHLAAGAQAQDWSLAATALGLFARALRMNQEAVLEAALPLAGPLIYQLSCGFSRSANPRWELL